MKASGPLLAAATVAGLLAAGCDYWKNLVDEKTVTKVPLILTVRDAWTHDSIPDAECADDLRGIKETADGEGHIALPDAGTGPYALTCSSPLYYPATKAFSVGGSGSAVNVDLARHGLDEWYQDDTTRQIRFPAAFDTLRYPLHFQLGSLPKNNGLVFRYAWSFARNKDLDQPMATARNGMLNLILSGDAKDVRNPGPDTVTVTIYSALRGPDSLYVVGSYTMPFEWVRNKLPTWELLNTSSGLPRVGCKSDLPISVTFTAADSDGTCKVIFYTRDTSSSLGPVHMERPCAEKSTVTFPLADRSNASSSEGSVMVNNKLYMDVLDDNNEFHHDSLVFQTKTNVRPTASAGRFKPQVAYFPRTPVRIWIEGRDTDGPVYDAKIDWGDGNVIDTLKDDNTNDLRDTISHKYNTAGTWSPILFITDNCPDGAFATFLEKDSIRVRNDTKPKITLETLGYVSFDDSLQYSIKLSVLDPDADDQFDTLQVTIDWGDGKTETLPAFLGSLDNASLPHRYLTPPADGTAFYKLRVKATDTQNESDVVSQPIPERGP